MCLTVNPCSAALGFILAFAFPLGLSSQQSGEVPGLNPPQVIKSNVNEVIVPVVVRDSQGHLVRNLSRHDFQVFDDGKPRVLTGFMLIENVAGAGAASSTNATAPNALPAPDQPQSSGQRFVVLLFDDLNLNNSELTAVRKAASKVLESSLSSTDTAAVLATSGTNSGLTRDRAVLQKALLNLKSQKTSEKHRDCPDITDYEADLIVNRNDAEALSVAADDAGQCANLPAAGPAGGSVATQMAQQEAQRVVAAGERNLRTNFDFLRVVVSKMAGLPGQRVLIFVSPGFLTNTSEATDRKSEILDIAARGNVTLNALDATGLSTTNAEASERAVNPGASATTGNYRQAAILLSQSVLAELADGSGGTLFHNNNNFEAGLASLFTGPEYLYLLAFSTTGVKANGTYHKLTVKVARDGVQVQARRGYFAPKEDEQKVN
jgi:VWFA-related protein